MPTNDVKSKLKESFLRMGLSPELAEAAATGREGAAAPVPAAPYVGGRGEGDPLTDPAALPDPTPDYEKTLRAKPNVPGKFSTVDTGPGQTVPLSFEDALVQLSVKIEDVMAVVAGLKLKTNRDQAISTLSFWLTARGFKPADANRAAAALVPDDTRMDKVSAPSSGKESRRFLAMDADGKALAILEAADETDASLYGFRKLEGYTGKILEIGQTGGIAEAFEHLGIALHETGLDAQSTREWMDARGIEDVQTNTQDLRVIAVPYQAPNPKYMKAGHTLLHENIELRERRK